VHKTRFESANHILEEIQKSLSVYLESKRRIFPRFYFLSDDELIEILSQTKDPFIINKHIGKCFEAINLLVFEGTKIKAMRSQEGEEVKFLSSIDVELPENKGNVEVWLKDIEYQMK
jgi:dynein heavy chain